MLQELHLGLPGGFEKVINYASHRRIDEIRETWKIRLSTMAAVSGRRHRLVIKNNYIVVIISILLQLELVCIDFLTIEQHKEGHQTCIVITDHLARYAQARPARNQTTRTTAQITFSPTFFLSVPTRQSTSRVTLSKSRISLAYHDTQKVAVGIAHVKILVKL